MNTTRFWQKASGTYEGIFLNTILSLSGELKKKGGKNEKSIRHGYYNFIVLTHMPDFIVSAIANTGWPTPVTLFVILLSYIVLGCIFDATPTMIITLPFVLPIITNMGFSPVWWGIVNVVVTEIGLITPPIGLNVFVLQAVAEKYPIKTVFKGILPFLFADIARLTLLTSFPIIALWLPSLISR